MERRRAVLLVAGITAGVIATGAVIGAVLDARSSGGTQSPYTISVEQVEDRTTVENESIVGYEELSATQQRQFDRALDGRFESESLALDPSNYVRYNDTVYAVVVMTA